MTSEEYLSEKNKDVVDRIGMKIVQAQNESEPKFTGSLTFEVHVAHGTASQVFMTRRDKI